MKYKALSLFGLCVVILASCDPFQEDSIPKELQLTINASATEYYILPKSSVVIDLKLIVNSSFTNATMKVSENPTRGKLTSLGNFLLKYESDTTFTEGSDNFNVEFNRDGKKLRTETLTVHMMEATSDFPCSLYAVTDTVSIYTDSIISINVLNNDRICGIDEGTLKVSIYSQPEHGQAELIGDSSIVYTPEPELTGRFEFYYEISGTRGDSTLTSFGSVIISVNEKICDLPGEIYYVLDLTDDKEDPTVIIPDCDESKSGYEIRYFDLVTTYCEEIDQFGYLGMTQSTHCGYFCIDMGGHLSYIPNSTGLLKSDTAKLKFLFNEVQTTLVVYVKREEFKIIEHSSDLTLNLATDDPNCGAAIGYYLRMETSPGSYDSSCLGCLGGGSGGCSAYVDAYQFSLLPDGKYAFIYDIIGERGQPPHSIDFTVTWSSSKGTNISNGHDTEDLLGGPKPIQYFEKRGSSIFVQSIIDPGLSKSTDLNVSLKWDGGDGTPGDVNLDVYLWQVKIGSAWELGGDGAYLIKASENSGSNFEIITANLGSDDYYFVVVDYKGGTSDNVKFELTVTTSGGTINSVDKKYSVIGTYNLSNLGKTNSNCADVFAGPCNTVLRFFKYGTNLKYLK